jgi:uncharacterized NAD-dependent epimerase/dehydratase family protein
MRRLVILAEGRFSVHGAKTAVGVLRFSPDQTVAVLDGTHAGQDAAAVLGLPEVGAGVPVVASVADALAYQPTDLLIGIAPIGGRLPDAWRPILLDAMAAKLHIISGLHVFLDDDPALHAAAEANGVTIWDVRRPLPEYAMRIGLGTPHPPGSRTVYFAGSDCNVGKMTGALALDQEARTARGWRSVFAATGQTGIMISGVGVPTDRVISDFVNGAVEKLVLDLAAQYQWIFVEGQGTLCHPAYSAVTLGLLHGARPDVQIMCHEAGRTHINEYPAYPLPTLRDLITMYETAASWLHPAPVVGIALNTVHLREDEARAAIAAAQDETGLPATDPVRFGAAPLLDALASWFSRA